MFNGPKINPYVRPTGTHIPIFNCYDSCQGMNRFFSANLDVRIPSFEASALDMFRPSALKALQESDIGYGLPICGSRIIDGERSRNLTQIMGFAEM
jgi:hypothetical protein